MYLTGLLGSKIILVTSVLWVKKFQQSWKMSARWATTAEDPWQGSQLRQIYMKIDCMERINCGSKCSCKTTSGILSDILGSEIQFCLLLPPLLLPQTLGHKSVTKFTNTITSGAHIHVENQIIVHFHKALEKKKSILCIHNKSVNIWPCYFIVLRKISFFISSFKQLTDKFFLLWFKSLAKPWSRL